MQGVRSTTTITLGGIGAVHRLAAVIRRGRSPVALLATVALALSASACHEEATVGGEPDEALTQAQCSFFAIGDKVQICHRTGSARNPYNIIRTNAAACGGHSGHAGDYITSTDPASPIYDPTCNGQGCLPEGAPSDPTIECCDGLGSVAGTCRDINECATNNGGCGAGFTCANAAIPGAAPTCTDINECAPGGGSHCSANAACTNTAGGFTCACNPGYAGDGVTCTRVVICGDGTVAGGEACDDANTVPGDGCSAACGVEVGYQCAGSPSQCASICGDGVIAGGEACDDGNNVAGDGCSPSCTVEANGCAASPCGNGGVCTPNGPNGYSCACAGFYTGTNCEIPPACAAAPCQNGGTCTNTGVAPGYSCTCAGSYTGTNCETLTCPSASAPAHQWTFNDGTAGDSVGGSNGTLFGGASITGGALVLDNLGTAPNQHLTGQYMKAALSDGVSTKTLVVWARLDGLTQHGGSALTIEDRTVDNTGSNHFDAIDYAEQLAGQWMAGSDNFNRTKVGSNGGAAETSTNAVMLAIVYGTDHRITIYRNGALYMNPTSYVKGTLLSYLGGASDAVIGLRHSQCNTNCWLSGAIDEARIYPTALTACQIQALQPVPQPPCPAGSEEFEGTCYVHVVATGKTQPQAEAACVADYNGTWRRSTAPRRTSS